MRPASLSRSKWNVRVFGGRPSVAATSPAGIPSDPACTNSRKVSRRFSWAKADKPASAWGFFIFRLLSKYQPGGKFISMMIEIILSDVGLWHWRTQIHVRFSNRPVGVKHFQTVYRCNVDVTHGLALLSGIGTRALVWGFLCQGMCQGRASFSFGGFLVRS